MNRIQKLMLLLIVPVFCAACSFSAARGSNEYQTALDLIDKGVLYLEQGFDEQAYATFEVAFETFPSAAALDGLGCVELHRGNLQSAKKFFQEAYNFDSSYQKALAHLAMIAEIEGRSIEAKQLYEEYLFAVPGDVRVRNNYAAFLFDQKNERDLIKARQELLRANSIDSLPLVHDNFTKVEHNNGNRN